MSGKITNTEAGNKISAHMIEHYGISRIEAERFYGRYVSSEIPRMGGAAVEADEVLWQLIAEYRQAVHDNATRW